MLRLTVSLTLAMLALPAALADETPPPAIDIDDALARQSISDLISGVETAYDCVIGERALRRVGTDDERIYLVEVSLDGPECEDALLLLSRHGSTKNFVFRAWEAPVDIREHDAVPGEDRRVDPLEGP